MMPPLKGLWSMVAFAALKRRSSTVVLAVVGD
jgi:hypothetical protein